MPITQAFQTIIDHISILDQNGRFDEKLGKDLIPDEDVVRLYEHMSICRHLDEVAFKLQRSGRMGTYPQNMGQEATSLGAAYALRKSDWLVPCYRENAGLFWRGLPMEYILLHWMGDERGNQIPRELFITPLAIPIGTQMLHATGLAWAHKYRGEENIACTFFGDGATSEGDFHEAMNFAANLDIPVVFFCQNNFWAISVPGKIQCSAPTVAQRGVAYGMECIQCDGNDLFACVYATRQAAERARKDKRPTFIEAVTYRLGDHTTADDARRYRDQAEVDLWKQRDPLIRLREWMKSRKLWNDTKEAALAERAERDVAAAVKRAEEIAAPHSNDFFDHMFAEPPADLVAQRDSLQTHSLAERERVEA
ncbi:MAG TPA: pyruvate dehydrogenase (acetyl-transferring) E1 component subunit alpha [Phycisphaerales bacterium]|nr:pyruvate dehydrogenase (acetyl-transferring) E1 component subunit alpha [Phycisphaerales bacterium]HMP37516.1 pyruvate dehydrogenase (acetyl-transferring) E1 component subunit alpha [Phycisphaerales bacterium]